MLYIKCPRAFAVLANTICALSNARELRMTSRNGICDQFCVAMVRQGKRAFNLSLECGTETEECAEGASRSTVSIFKLFACATTGRSICDGDGMQ